LRVSAPQKAVRIVFWLMPFDGPALEWGDWVRHPERVAHLPREGLVSIFGLLEPDGAYPPDERAVLVETLPVEDLERVDWPDDLDPSEAGRVPGCTIHMECL
jgi:hypothetical protein